MLKTTVLHSRHQALAARLVDFAGWAMPLQYTSQVQEHHAVRTVCGMFDVCHMCVVDVRGDQAEAFLQHLLANDVAKLKAPGRALYSCMLNHDGGVVDDLIVYRIASDWFRVVVNAATTDTDLDWISENAAAYAVAVLPVAVLPRRDLGIVAVQGPQARVTVAPHLPATLARQALDLKPFSAGRDGEWFVGRTGYTGEDGFELMLPHAALIALWDALIEDGVVPCGLGARDTLRLEAGLNLYGQDMDETVTPLECGLGWTVAWSPASRHFIGRRALEVQRARPPREALGLVMQGRGVLRAHMAVRRADGAPAGVITSGGFGPTVGASIALARVAAGTRPPLQVEVRGSWQPVRIVRPPFVRNRTVLV